MSDEESAKNERAAHIVTLRDIAEAASVSVSTVSRALASNGLVNRRTEGRIQRIAESMGYRPNALARSLVTRSSGLVGLMLHNLVNASFQKAAQVIQSRLADSGYQLLLCVTGDSPTQEAAFLSTLFDHRVEGLLILPTGENNELVERFVGAGMAVVGLIRRQAEAPYDSVLLDDVTGAYDGTRYLLQLGHRRIGVMVGRLETNSGRERLEGYRRALREFGIEEDPAYIFSGPYNADFGASSCAALLSLPKRPTALFAANHEASFGVVRVLSEQGISIPGELSLLCYEDEPWFNWQKPAISVVDGGPEALANLAVELLLRRIARPQEQESGRELRIGAKLVLRESCAAPSAI
jgi:LacI family transcriptional regulator